MAAATLRFKRHTPYADRIRDYRLFVDKEQVGTLANGATLELAVAPGDHLVEARIDWCRSAPLTLSLAEGEVTTIQVTNTYGALLSLWAITFGRSTYLKLTRTG